MKDKIVCILLGIFLAFAGLELFLRLLGFGYDLVHKTSPRAGEGYRIYCVGESTTWGVGASDRASKNYPRQLEEMLNKQYPSANVQCLFDQTIGQNTSEILAKLPRHIMKYRPQLIVLLVGVNNRWNMDRSNILLFSKNTTVSRATLQVLIFLDQFRVWKLFKSLAFAYGFPKEHWDFFVPPSGEAREELERKKEEAGSIFDDLAEHDIEEMIKLCKASHIPVILCTYPMHTTIGLRRSQQDLARQFDVPLVDHYEAFQKLQDPQAYLWPKDSWHPNDAGYELMAKNIYDCILRNRFVEGAEKKISR
ncbi:MAG: SGNH/GDSL hydrolase family protein [Candidatus Omnitrophota bacterium]